MTKFNIITYSIILTIASVFTCNAYAQPNTSNIVFASSPKFEERAVWLATIGGIDWPRTKATDINSTERQKKELRDILDKLKNANINVVLLQTRIRGSVIYPSDIEPWDQAITGHPGKAPSYDPLQFAIEECHKRGIELHAWLVSIPLGTAQRQRSYGNKSITSHHPELCKTVGGETFMIPGQTGTADYIADICKEIVTRYDVDGISLDYIRYPESQYKFNDDNLYKKAQSQGYNRSISDWRRDNITRIVHKVHDVVKPIKPWVKLSSSPIGKYRDLSRFSSGGWNCYNAVYQAPQEWLRDNKQDMLFPMMYFLGNNFYPFLFDWNENRYGHPVVPGLGIYFLDPHEGKWTLNDVRAQMHTARKSQIGGIAFYRNQYLVNNTKGLYDTSCEEFFPYPALTTPMRWMKNTGAPSKPNNLIKKGENLSWQYDEPIKDNKCQRILFNIYSSNEYPVDITKAENIVATRVQEKNIQIDKLRSDIGCYFAVTAINRYGFESEALQEKDHGPMRTIEFIRDFIKDQYKAPAKNIDNKQKTKNKPTKTKTAKNKTKVKNNKSTPKEDSQSTKVTVIDFSKYLD